MCPPMPFWSAPRGLTPEYDIDRSQRRGLITRISMGAGGLILFAVLTVNLVAGDWLLNHVDGDPQRFATGLVLLTAVITAATAGALAWWWLRREAVLRAYDRQRSQLAGGAATGALGSKTFPAPAPSDSPTSLSPDTKDSTS